MSTNKNNDGCKPETGADHSDSELFEKVVSILDHARGNVVKAINNQMAIAYWLIGREIVQALQGEEGRAEYGKQVIENLSKQLTKRYGKGFSATNLKYFRTFYLAYPDRLSTIRHPLGDELPAPQKGHPESKDDIMYRLYVIDKIRKGREAADRGEVISIDELKKEIELW